MNTSNRLFIGIFPAGISYSDRSREEHGDYMKLGFLSYSTLELEIYDKQLPTEMKREIEEHATTLQVRRGETFQISGSGQTVLLGSDAP